MAHNGETHHDWVLPAVVVGPVELNRLKREVEELAETLHEAKLRHHKIEGDMPAFSRALREIVDQNKLDLTQEKQRDALVALLETGLKHAPVVHISLPSEPSMAFTSKLVLWLRKNIHPMLLVQLGLQPTLAAGCTVRTPTHYYDFSLRQHLLSKKSVLIQKLETMSVNE